jgi:hypothetical protein
VPREMSVLVARQPRHVSARPRQRLRAAASESPSARTVVTHERAGTSSCTPSRVSAYDDQQHRPHARSMSAHHSSAHHSSAHQEQRAPTAARAWVNARVRASECERVRTRAIVNARKRQRTHTSATCSISAHHRWHHRWRHCSCTRGRAIARQRHCRSASASARASAADAPGATRTARRPPIRVR